MQNDYGIMFPSRDTQRTPPYTGYIEIEPVKCPEYGRREKPLWRENPTTYKMPTGEHPGFPIYERRIFDFNLEQIICSKKISDDMFGTRNTLYCPIIKEDNFSIGITHHDSGFGKLKINDNGREYQVPLTDVMNQPLSDWRIQRH